MSPPESLSPLMTVACRVRHMLAPDSRVRIARFLASEQHESGGFADRGGHPDLYYTVFGLGSLLALGLPVPHRQALRAFLAAFLDFDTRPFVEVVSWIRCQRCLQWAAPEDSPASKDEDALCQRALRSLERYRTLDGGFGHERTNAATSTAYAGFLALQAARDAGLPLPNSAGVVRALESLEADEGGYANHPGRRHGITTATAAAALLFEQGGVPARASDALAFIDTMRLPSGGYVATRGSGMADLLSTATALYAVESCGAALDAAACRSSAAFVESLWHDSGGFAGHPADAQPDVEYTFYALLALGALRGMESRRP